jgi:tryptophan 2,3-dioxygenase
VLLVALAKWQQQVVLLENPIERMKKYDKTQFFVAEIAKAESYYNSLQLHKKQNKNKKITNETVRAAYQEIYQKMENRFEAICQYIEHFDYIAYRSADQATTVAIEEELAALADLIDKLNRLDTINIKIENMALDNDTDRIKFLIESLEELNAKDE